jgi:hypothetical protein
MRIRITVILLVFSISWLKAEELPEHSKRFFSENSFWNQPIEPDAEIDEKSPE